MEDTGVPFKANRTLEVLSISQTHCAATDSLSEDNTCVANAVKWSVRTCALQLNCQAE